MKSADRKLAYSALIILAIVVFEVAWWLFVGPADHSPYYATECESNCDIPFWAAPEFWTAAFTAALTCSTVALWRVTRSTWVHAQESSERQLRAYLLIETGSVFDASRIGVQGSQPGTLLPQLTNFPATNLTLKNSGQTPAKNVRHWANITVSDAANEHLLLPPKILDGTQASVVGPGTSVTKSLICGPFPLTQDVVDDILIGNKAIYVFGKIEYDDWFGIHRTTHYRLRYSGAWPPIPSGDMLFAMYGNDAS